MIKKNIKNIIVLGMHRSRISMVTGILNKTGINIVDDLLAKIHQPLLVISGTEIFII